MIAGNGFPGQWRFVGRSHHKRCVGRDDGTAQHIVRLYRVIGGRAVSRGSASSASCCCRRTTSLVAPPAWLR